MPERSLGPWHSLRAFEIAAFALSVGLVGCQAREGSIGARVPDRGPVLRLVDSLLLQEPDSLYLGKPGHHIAVGAGGALFVPDESRDQVIEYSPTGVPVKTFGRHGRGPGELVGIGATFVVDSYVVQLHGLRQATVYAVSTGNVVTTHTFRGYASSIAPLADSVFVGVFDLETRRGVASISRRRFFSPPQPLDTSGFSVAGAAAFPSAYRRFADLEVYNLVSLLANDTVLVVGYASGSDDLLFVDRKSGRVDSLEIPVRRRRGTPVSALKRFDRRRRVPVERQIGALSGLSGLWRLSDAAIVIWHADNSLNRTAGRGSGQLSGRAFLSLLSPDLRVACVDGEVPLPGTAYPRLTIARDTVHVLDQFVPEHGRPRAVSVLRKYVIDRGECGWVPTRLRRG